MFHIPKIGFLGKTGIRIIVGLLSENCGNAAVKNRYLRSHREMNIIL